MCAGLNKESDESERVLWCACKWTKRQQQRRQEVWRPCCRNCGPDAAATQLCIDAARLLIAATHPIYPVFRHAEQLQAIATK